MGSRRGNNEGTVFKRRDGRWTAKISLPDGTRKSYYGRTREAVTHKMIEGQKAVLDGQALPSERKTVSVFSEDWLESIKGSIRYKTWENYEALIRIHVVPTLGRLPITQLGPMHLTKLYANLVSSGLSPQSTGNVHRVLHNMLEKAVRWDVATRNVAKLVDPPKVKIKEKISLTVGETKNLLAAARGHRLEALFVLALTIGARSGELLGLAWDNVNLETGEIKITRSLQWTSDGWSFGEPKTSSSKRLVAIPDMAVEALKH